jgi:hypothetical protein
MEDSGDFLSQIVGRWGQRKSAEDVLNEALYMITSAWAREVFDSNDII